MSRLHLTRGRDVDPNSFSMAGCGICGEQRGGVGVRDVGECCSALCSKLSEMEDKIQQLQEEDVWKEYEMETRSVVSASHCPDMVQLNTQKVRLRRAKE